jgi:NADH-quinone oxidoreductase subunit H
MSALMVTLFLGGWHFYGMEALGVGEHPWATTNIWAAILSVVVFFVKMFILVWLYIQVRWTLPRFRYDQLMNVGWKGIVPAALTVLTVTAIWIAWRGMGA